MTNIDGAELLLGNLVIDGTDDTGIIEEGFNDGAVTIGPIVDVPASGDTVGKAIKGGNVSPETGLLVGIGEDTPVFSSWQ
jgi:hypothetical protein